ncbi:MAG: hypothetical protein SFU99_16310 [Saprospiraceae bacterium]|nr:hypothetical protein [Saprospiraceae bacterium]
MTIEAKKYHLIEQITAIQEEALLNRLEVVLQELTESNQLLLQLAKPMRDKLNIEELIKEQDFQGVDKEKIGRLIEEIALDEPIEELIEAVR